MSFEDILRGNVVLGYNSLTAKEELEEMNIKQEYKGLLRLYKLRDYRFIDKQEEARFKILKFIITSAIYDPLNGDYYSEENNKLIEDAGELLYEYGGMDEMLYIMNEWDFIPKRYKGSIDYLWDEIGEWKG